jgi:membrane fusion protein, multidrug efflux system
VKNRTSIGIGAAFIIAFIFILFRLIHNGGPATESSSPETRVEVKVVKVDAVTDTLIFEAQGRVTTKRSYSVTSLSEGKIKKASVSVGEQVKTGQVIALLENSELDRELSLQNDKLLLIRKTVQNLEKKVKASEEMLSLGIISESDFISLKQELNARQIEEHDLEITNDRLKSREKNYRITTGVDGYVSDILPQESFVVYGQAVAGIVSLKDEQIEAFIPFDQVNRPAPGDEALITCNSFTVHGNVLNSYPSANSNLITVIVIPEKPVPMNLEVKVTFKVHAVNGLIIPKSAVVMVEGKPVIFTVKNSRAFKKDITVVKDYLDRALVVDDLGPDNVIVTENAYLLADSVNVVVK